MLVAPECRGVEWLMDVVLVGVALSDLGDQLEVTTNTIFSCWYFSTNHGVLERADGWFCSLMPKEQRSNCAPKIYFLHVSWFRMYQLLTVLTDVTLERLKTTVAGMETIYTRA